MGDIIKWNMPIDSNMSTHRAKKALRYCDWQDVIAVGYDKDGNFMVRSSKMSRKDALWLLEQAKIHALDIL